MRRLGRLTLSLALAAATAAVLVTAESRAVRAEQQVECSLPSGKVAQLSRTQCREQVGLVLRVLPGGPPAGSAAVSPANPHDYALIGVGSGFFVTPGGTVLTNAHVVDPCEELLVHSAGARPVTARVAAADPISDLAVVETRLRPPAVASIRTAPDAAVGERVLIVGFPGESESQWPHIGPGIVTRLPPPGGGRLVALSFVGHAEGGMSGGPLLDEQGRVAGVVFAASEPVSSRNETWREHGSAIEATAVRDFLSRSGVRYSSADGTTPQPHLDVDALARAMTVRVFCFARE